MLDSTLCHYLKLLSRVKLKRVDRKIHTFIFSLLNMQLCVFMRVNECIVHNSIMACYKVPEHMYPSTFLFLAGLGIFFMPTVIKPAAEMAPNMYIVFALVAGPAAIARVPFLGQVLERFVFISKADPSKDMQFVRKSMFIFSHLQTQL